MRPDVVFATMALARTQPEAALLARALEELARFGRPVVVADGGSAPELLTRLATVRNIDVRNARFGSGLVSQIRTAIDGALATGHRIVCYTEPDKLDFFRTGIERFLDDVQADRPFGVALAARSARSFETFPPLQQYTERAINDLVGEVIGQHGDYSYGPFAMSREVAREVVALEQDPGWGWRHYAFVTARDLGQTVVLHSGEFECPIDQRTEDARERMHRVRQLEQNTRGLLLAVGAG
jgi:hypothetical protein